MRRLVDHCGVPGHIYPLALLCHDIMPPPQKVHCSPNWVPFQILAFTGLIRVTFFFFFSQVEKEVGERRIVSFHGTGLSAAPAVSFSSIIDSAEQSEEVGISDTHLFRY